MLFNSIDFGIFLIIVYVLYWVLGSKRRVAQNALILVASYVFYGLWDWRFLGLIFASSILDFIAGHYIFKSVSIQQRRFWLVFSIFWNLGILFVFKYLNFFLDNFYTVFSSQSYAERFQIWDVVIPVGLSFYTLQTLSYSIDVYRGKYKPTDNLLNYLCYVSFFPQLVAGPIERASALLPQFERKRSFNIANVQEGLRQILWGLFKKILVADRLAAGVNMVYDNPGEYSSLSLAMASLLFSFQVYYDFSGYSDIAIGTARLFGFKLSVNFRLFYLSKSLSSFWRVWHITLIRWFTDYVYIPLVSNWRKKLRYHKFIAIVLTTSLIGLWHGASWSFVFFGVTNGLLLFVERQRIGQVRVTKILSQSPAIITTIYTFTAFVILGVFFRSQNLNQAFEIFSGIGKLTWSVPFMKIIGGKGSLLFFSSTILTEVFSKNKDYPFQEMEKDFRWPYRLLIYYVIIGLIVMYGQDQETFVYFQF